MSLKKKCGFLLSAFLFLFVFSATHISADGGGKLLYENGFITGSDPDKMVLNEEKMLTREQLALLIIELNGLKEEALDAWSYPNFEDGGDIAAWARPFVAYSVKKSLMKGESAEIFNPKGLVTGKQLGAVMLRALGYEDVPWSGVQEKLKELGIAIKDEALTRGRAFDYIWKVINEPITTEGNTLGYQLGKIDTGILELPDLNFEKSGLIYVAAQISYDNRVKDRSYLSYLVKTDQGYQLIKAQEEGDKFYIESYTKDWKFLKRVEREVEGDLFGGFYEGEKHYYIVFGSKNEIADDNKTVLKLVKYDKDFNVLASLDIKNAYTTLPFYGGNLNMAEKGSYLAIHTARRRYSSDDGRRHQSQLTVVVDTEKMQVINHLGPFQTNHVSHSFDQYVFYDERDRLVLIDHGDGYPRSLVLQVLTKDGKIFYTEKEDVRQRVYKEYEKSPSLVRQFKFEGYNYFELLSFPGPVGANVTGTSVGNIVAGPNSYLIGTNRMDYDLAREKDYVFDSFFVKDEEQDDGGDVDYRNVFIDVVDKDDFSVRTKQLTSDASPVLRYSAPKIVKLKDDRYMVLWERKSKKQDEKYDFLYDKEYEFHLQYLIMDEKGEVLVPVKTLLQHRLYEMDPVYADGKVFWLGVELVDRNDEKMYKLKTTLYSISVNEAALK